MFKSPFIEDAEGSSQEASFNCERSAPRCVHYLTETWSDQEEEWKWNVKVQYGTANNSRDNGAALNPSTLNGTDIILTRQIMLFSLTKVHSKLHSAFSEHIVHLRKNTILINTKKIHENYIVNIHKQDKILEFSIQISKR